MDPLPFRPPWPPHVVIVIIDDEEHLALTVLALQLAGFHAIGASSVEQAFGRIPLIPPEAIVADLRRGSSHDWRRLRELQAGTAGADPLLVLVVNAGDAVPSVLAASCTATMRRPVEADAVVSAVRAVLS